MDLNEFKKEFKYDNLNLTYFEINNHKDKDILFLHGYTLNFEYFAQLFDELSKYYNIYGINMPGHGTSQGQDSYMKPLVFVDIFIKWFKSMNFKNKVDIFGFSLGGGMALASVKKLNKDIKNMIVVGPANRSNEPKKALFFEKFFANNLNEWKEMVPYVYYDPEKFMANPVVMQKANYWFDNCQENIRLCQIVGRKLYDEDFMQEVDYGIKNIKSPLCLMYGEADGLIDLENIDKYFKKLNKNTVCYRFNKTGHNVWAEQYDLVMSKIKDFYNLK